MITTNNAHVQLNTITPTVEQMKARTIWINLVSPPQAKISSVLTALSLPRDTLNQPRTSLLKKIGDVLLLKLEIPKRNLPNSAVPYQVTMLTILVKDNKVVTISEGDCPLLMRLEHEYLVRWAEQDITSFVYRILSITTTSFLNATKEVSETIDKFEEKLKSSFSNRSVYQLINHNKSFLYFSRALNRNHQLLKTLEEKSYLKADNEQDLTLSDLIVETAQAESLARVYNSNLSSLMDAYSALIENNLSLSVQYLTIFVTISAIPMAVAGIYGMNTPLPIQDEPYALVALAGLSVFLIVVVLGFFKKKKLI
ncbi:magnesium transporter CorA family protein [Ignatzschineria rhizosphaerae]|uniref:Magnesium transporter CorA family protein n=1 Tax=Ignatzschineria rhizosphaerae TaxID=2923279 RepID=A0ABY3X2L4_9GAMM|nr:magnesium transporter CorA family protein [Ignatzschineria rhizosphaerae]UNM97106.1 magnesium transporter CorA family protein [Ignatzschineria rhizosphaerae]